MVIDAETMIFTDLTDEQAQEMLAWSLDVVVRGNIPQPEPDWVEPLLTHMGFRAREQKHNRLLYLSTVLPQRILLAVVFHMTKLVGDRGGKRTAACTL